MNSLLGVAAASVRDASARLVEAKWAGHARGLELRCPARVQMSMLDPTRIRDVVAFAAALFAAAGGVVAQEGRSAESQLYQQRSADGRIILNDRSQVRSRSASGRRRARMPPWPASSGK